MERKRTGKNLLADSIASARDLIPGNFTSPSQGEGDDNVCQHLDYVCPTISRNAWGRERTSPSHYRWESGSGSADEARPEPLHSRNRCSPWNLLCDPLSLRQRDE